MVTDHVADHVRSLIENMAEPAALIEAPPDPAKISVDVDEVAAYWVRRIEDLKVQGWVEDEIDTLKFLAARESKDNSGSIRMIREFGQVSRAEVFGLCREWAQQAQLPMLQSSFRKFDFRLMVRETNGIGEFPEGAGYVTEWQEIEAESYREALRKFIEMLAADEKVD